MAASSRASGRGVPDPDASRISPTTIAAVDSVRGGASRRLRWARPAVRLGRTRSAAAVSIPPIAGRRQRDQEAQRGGSGGDRRVRRLGVLLAARRRPRDQGRHAVRPAVGLVLPGDGRRPAGRVPAAPRPAPHDPAPQDQLPGERLGDALARRQGGDLAVRRRLAPAPRQAGRLRPVRPVRRPDAAAGPTRSSTARS